MNLNVIILNRFILIFFVSIFSSFSVSAHEFWLEPRSFTASVGDRLEVDVKIGQDFKARGMVFVPQRMKDMAITDSDGRRDVISQLGDNPALAPDVQHEGLNVITYHANPQTHKFRDYGKFLEYIDAHGLKDLATRHIQRDLPMSGFVESYARAGKTLIKIGDGKGQDLWTGMPMELVALTNPYTDNLEDGMKVQVLWQGQPMAGMEMHIFQRNQLTYFAKTKTDENGVASIPVNSGGAFLLNSVHIYEPTNPDADHAWESYWASLTYEISQ